MPRPRKWRRVCGLPNSDIFGPLDVQNVNQGLVIMTVEEYETIRLIDLEGLTQEECAESMNVARTTVQRIYNDARRKLAHSLVNVLSSKLKAETTSCVMNRGEHGVTVAAGATGTGADATSLSNNA